MEPDPQQSKTYSTEQAKHTHKHMHYDWKPRALEKAEGRQQASLKQVVCKGKLPSEVPSEDSCLSVQPSFKFYILNKTTGI